MSALPAWRAAFRLRWIVLRRRFLSPLEGVVLGVVSWLAWMVGGALAERLLQDPAQFALGGGLFLLGLCALGTRVAGRLLYGSRELVLLVGHGLSPRALVRLRALELGALACVALIPGFLAVAGGLAKLGRAPSGLLAAAIPVLAAGVAGLSLLGAWSWGRLGPGVRRALGGLAFLGAAGVFALAFSDPQAGLAWARQPATPSGWVLALAAGSPAVLLGLALGAFVLVCLADRLAPRDFGAGLDRAARRSARTRFGGWAALGLVLRPLGGQAAALLRRDLSLLLRGAYPRGLLTLGALPVGLGVVRAVTGDAQLQPWQLQLAALLVLGVQAATAGFLFGVDYPRARRRTLILERTQPLRGRAVLLSRWLPAAGVAVLLSLGAAALVGLAPRAPLARMAGSVAIAGPLLALIITHHAVAYGMRGEARIDPAEATAYPLMGGFLVVLFAFALVISPWLALAYPLLWFGFVSRSLRIWETAEVEAEHEASA